MELSVTPDTQLLRIYHAASKEIERRKVNRRTRDSFKATAKEFAKEYPDVWGNQNPNSRECLAINMDSLSLPPTKKMRYLKPLLGQDWAHLFADGDPTPKYYVYAHVDPSSKSICLSPEMGGQMHFPFYIGKGVGSRAYDLNRNQGHGLKIKALRAKGYMDKQLVHIIRTNLPEQQAFELEAKLIYFFGTVYEDDRNGILYNLDTSQRPSFERTMTSITKIKASKPHKIAKDLEKQQAADMMGHL